MKVKVTKDTVIITEYSPVNAGERGLNVCEFQLPQEFSALTVTATFNNIPVPVCEGECVIPTLKKGTAILGVYAYKESEAGVELMYSPKPTAFYVNDGSYTDEAAIKEIPSISEYEKYCQMFATALMEKVNDREKVTNKTLTITENSTHEQYPTAKGVFDLVEKENQDKVKKKVFEKIATVTVTADSDGNLPAIISITADDEGNSFELTDIYCEMLIGMTDGPNGKFYVEAGGKTIWGNGNIDLRAGILRRWCLRYDSFGEGNGGLVSAPGLTLAQSAVYPSANVSDLFGQVVPVGRTLNINSLKLIGQVGATKTFMEGTTITLWGVRK